MCSKDKSLLEFDRGKRGIQTDYFSGDEGDDLISQAYDAFIVAESKMNATQEVSHDSSNDQDPTCSRNGDKKGLVKPDQSSSYCFQNATNKIRITDGNILTSVQNQMDNESENNMDMDLITIEDLLGYRPVSAGIEGSPDLFVEVPIDDRTKVLSVIKTLRELSLAAINAANVEEIDQDLNESSIIATVILMQIFDRACKESKPVKRWRKSNPATWKINLAKKRRAEGSVYEIKNKIRPAKAPKEVDCSNCSFDCSNKIKEDIRMDICRKYWSLDFVAQKNFILANVEVKAPKTISLQRKRDTKRAYSTQCSFKQKDTKIKVCQKFFQKTLCIGQAVISNAVKNRDSIGHYKLDCDPRGRCEPANKTSPEKVEEVCNHIRSFPTMESHYTRKESKRQYLDCKLSIGKMYSLYEEDCKGRNSKPVSEVTYRRIFGTNFNLGFFTPKKDQCLLCVRYARGDARKDEKFRIQYEEHITRKEVVNKEKEKDKVRAGEEAEFSTATFDLQSVLQIPSGDMGPLYYKRKLTVYNLTLYEGALPNEAYCFTWSEINGMKGSCEIGTILYNYLAYYIPKHVTEVSLFSDTCGGQNRNKNVAAVLLWAAHKTGLNIIEQKFLESGHSYMEADSMHSSIESAQKHTVIYSMSDWLNVFRRARSRATYKKDSKVLKKEPYKVKEYKYQEFKDLKDLTKKILKNTTHDTEGKRVNWLKIKRLRFVKGELKMFFNYDMSETFSVIDVTKKPLTVRQQKKVAEKKSQSLQTEIENTVEKPVNGARQKRKKAEVEPLPTESKKINMPVYRTRQKNRKKEKVLETLEPEILETPNYLPDEILPLYKAPFKISIAKKNDLMDLCQKGTIPEEFHGWFERLNSDQDLVDRVPDCTASDEDPDVSSDDD